MNMVSLAFRIGLNLYLTGLVQKTLNLYMDDVHFNYEQPKTNQGEHHI